MNYFENEMLSPETLDILSASDFDDVRWCVARHVNTLKTTLIKLSKDKDRGVRLEVELNPNTPLYIKQYLQASKYVGRTLNQLSTFPID